jgi:hypothetical protein
LDDRPDDPFQLEGDRGDAAARDGAVTARTRSGRRLAALAGLLAAGAAIGAIGSWWTGSAAWYLAIPIALAVGWLGIADPTRCEPGAPGPRP